MQSLDPRPVRFPFLKAGGLGSGNTKRGDQLIDRQSENPSRRRRRAEHAATSGGVKALVILRAKEGIADPDHGLIAGDHAFEQGLAGCADQFRGSYCRRDDGDGGMEYRGAVIVVHLDRVPGRAVDQRRQQRIGAVVTTDNGTGFPATQFGDHVADDLARACGHTG